jgi:hypothetical protein
MVEKQTINDGFDLEKVFVPAGILFIFIGIAVNIFYAFHNSEFILQDPINLLYYLGNTILLVGGFLAGYTTRTKALGGKIYSGVIYASLIWLIMQLINMIIFILTTIFGQPEYPWAKILFSAIPVLAVIVAFATAMLIRRRQSSIVSTRPLRLLFVSLLVITQLFGLASVAYYSFRDGTPYFSGMPIWQIIVSILTTQVTVFVISYFVLLIIKNRAIRIFYSALIAAMYSQFSDFLWNLRVDASEESTNLFSIGVLIAAVVFVTAILWGSRRTIKRNTIQ